MGEQRKSKIKITADTGIALVAVGLSIVALVVSIFQAWDTREHNKKSVRPLLAMSLVTGTNGSGIQICVRVENVGFGPAIISDFSVLIPGGSMPERGRFISSTLHTYLETESVPTVDFLRPGQPIAAGEGITVISAQWTNAEEDPSRWAESIKHLDVVIEYSSLYDEAYRIGSRDFLKDPL